MKLKFETGKIEVLKMVSATLHDYSPENMIGLTGERITFLKEIIRYAIETIITSSIKKVKREICL